MKCPLDFKSPQVYKANIGIAESVRKREVTMDRKSPWENESGVQVLRLYKSDSYPDWPQAVNKTDLHPDWPRAVMLDLTAEQFSEFDRDPLAFAKKYNLYPEQPILWMSQCAKPPIGKGIPRATESSRWTVVFPHTPKSSAACAACPQTTTG